MSISRYFQHSMKIVNGGLVILFAVSFSHLFSPLRECPVWGELVQQKTLHCFWFHDLPRTLVIFTQINLGFTYLYLLDFYFITILHNASPPFFFWKESKLSPNYFSIRHFLTKYALPFPEVFKE